MKGRENEQELDDGRIEDENWYRDGGRTGRGAGACQDRDWRSWHWH